MKSVLRLYLTTSKGNDQFLYKQAKYDEHLHAFYFDAPMTTMFKIAHRSLIAQNMYVQVGKAFPATNQTVFAQRLERIQFKNYLPLRRGLIENLTLNILVRQTKYPISDNVMTSFIHNALQKEIVKRQYYRGVLQGDIRRDALPAYYDMKEIVERKWEQDDILEEKNQLLLEEKKKEEKLLIGDLEKEREGRQMLKKQENEALEKISSELGLPYQPNLTIYIKKNNARILLKVNQQAMYKLGWKRRVGWAPVRESIATAVMHQSGLLDTHKQTYIWDPFCGSGTFGLVSAAMHFGAWVRLEETNFNWRFWPIFRRQYLEEYFQMEKDEKKMKENRLKIICSDISFKAANNTVKNMKQFAQNLEKMHETQEKISKDEKIIKRMNPSEHWAQIMNGQWVVGCGDFQKLAENILSSDRKVNIITNLPYLKARSVDHMPLSQLVSVYRRFSRMIRKNKDKISNVFILIDNKDSNISNPNHFLSVSGEKWTILNSFQSGGLPVGLYAWSQNESQVKFQDSSALIETLKNEIRVINKAPDEELSTALTNYRKKVAEIEKKLYFLPEHLKKIKRGWRRVQQKRRRRHLVRAYQAFGRRRDKMIAFTQYAKKKLEVKMLKRGAIWRKRNMKLLTNIPIENFQKELKKEFEGRIQDALERNEQRQQYRRKRAKQTNEMMKKQRKQVKHVNPRAKRVKDRKS